MCQLEETWIGRMQTKAMLALERFEIADEGGLQNDMSWRDRCIGPTEHNGCNPAAKDEFDEPKLNLAILLTSAYSMARRIILTSTPVPAFAPQLVARGSVLMPQGHGFGLHDPGTLSPRLETGKLRGWTTYTP
jgi:hypothetical protein